MEIVIVIIIVALAVAGLVRMFTKQADGKSGCACDQKCSECPMEMNFDNSDSPKDSAHVIPSEVMSPRT